MFSFYLYDCLLVCLLCLLVILFLCFQFLCLFVFHHHETNPKKAKQTRLYARDETRTTCNFNRYVFSFFLFDYFFFCLIYFCTRHTKAACPHFVCCTNISQSLLEFSCFYLSHFLGLLNFVEILDNNK